LCVYLTTRPRRRGRRPAPARCRDEVTKAAHRRRTPARRAATAHTATAPAAAEVVGEDESNLGVGLLAVGAGEGGGGGEGEGEEEGGAHREL